MNHIELAKALQHKMFANRDSIDQALEYAYTIAKASENPAAVMTAVHVVINTICNELLKEEVLG